MDNTDLFSYVTRDREHPTLATLESWLKGSERFKNFAECYKDKIRKKISTAKSNEDLEDIIFELEIPYLLLLDGRFKVEYEKDGTRKVRAPDFSVSFEQDMEFNLEAKRIRESQLGDRFNRLIEQIVNRTKCIPSSLGFFLDMTSCDANPEFVDRFESAKEEVVQYIENSIRNEDSKLSYSTACEYPIPGFECDVILVLTKLSGKIRTDRTSYFGAVEPILYTQKEPYKFGDTIFDKLGQMIPGMINILVCTSKSSIHEPEDLFEAIASINQLIRKKDEEFFVQKGFGGIQDFLSQTKNLSGVLYKSTWSDQSGIRNLLWHNHQANLQIPEVISEYLQRM